MLIYRILSAFVGIPVILFSVWYGKLLLSSVILILVILGIFEMSRLWNKLGVNVYIPLALLCGVIYVTAAHLEKDYFLGAALFLTILTGVFYVITVYPKFTFTDLSATLLTPLYTGWLLTHLISIRHLPYGFHYVVLVLVSTWGTDTFAYFVGINFGKNKLAPVLSPKKSIEGSIGGVAGSIVAALIFGVFYGHMSVIHYVVIGLLIGIIGQIGDLVESAFKRMAAVKDSGRLIPGHGGILDRFDSLYLTAPVVYYYLKLIIMS